MSAFQINITPNRLKNARKNSETKEPTIVTLGLFSARATVTFENVPVTKTAKRTLIICNPSDEEIKVMVTKVFKPEYNISLEWTSQIIPSNGQVQMEIIWNPLIEIACKETLQLTDSRNFKKDIAVVLKSIKKTSVQPDKRLKIKSGSTGVKTLRLKSPVNAKKLKNKNLSTSKVMQQQKITNKQRNSVCTENELAQKRQNVLPLLERNTHRDYCSSDLPSRKIDNIGKENKSPESPSDISTLLEKVQFTPLMGGGNASKSPNNFDYLASFPTPVNRSRINFKDQDQSLLTVQPRKLCITSPENEEDENPSSAIQNQSIQLINSIPDIIVHTCVSVTDHNVKIDQEENVAIKKCSNGNVENYHHYETFNSEINEKIYERNDNNINKHFELPQIYYTGNDNNIPILNRTTTISAGPSKPLSIIEEERSQLFGETFNNPPLQKTFNLSRESTNRVENIMRDIQLVGTPLRKQFESMENLTGNSSKRKQIGIKGSMPNLNDMSEINSIDQNRYYQLQIDLDNSDVLNTSAISTTSTIDVVFREHEILAQSSRYNLNEVDKVSQTWQLKTPKTLKKMKSPILSINVSTSKQQSIKRNRQSVLESPTSLLRESNSKQQQSIKRNRQSVLESPTSLLREPNSKACALSISPPKRFKIDFNDTETTKTPSTPYTSKSKWSRTQPKMIKYHGSKLHLVRKTATPKKIKPEPRIALYNSDMFLQACINPDPFAATTTCDPFLASTMYLDEKNVDKHEAQFKKWLNALVAIPADLDSDCNQNIDVGQLFNQVRNQDLTLAPTREELCMNYLTKSRMDTLRRAAVQLYMSEEMRVPCSKVAVLINKQSIKIRADRDLHLDVVMQQYILSLLLSFNPIWLRIGLEVVFGEIIHLHSNADIVGLTAFIVNRLFRDKYLEQKYSRAYILSEEYAQQIKKFSLQNFLVLLLFLDKAKNHKIIKHNPCLFTRKSQYKETKQILLRFSSELLANVGDITRDLKRVNYVLTHKQTYLDEFDYAFKNLAVDLRDGVRLTRVMEIILLRDDLTGQLRVPAISRLQRIYNVNLALKSLEEANFSLTGNIVATDIVDGHREKTLSLLWQIIYKFRAPKFNAAATIIQTWWRKRWLKVLINRRIRHKLEVKRHKAATVIQSAFRGYRTRKYVQVYKKERETAVICLQKYIRKFLAQRHFRIAIRKIIYIQQWYRRSKTTKEVRKQFLHVKQSVYVIQCWYRRILLARKIEIASQIIRELKGNAKLQYEKSLIIQRSLKSYMIRKKLQTIINGIVNFNRQKKLQHRSAEKIQSFFRMIDLRKQFLMKKKSAITIQKHWRNYQLMKNTRNHYLLQKSSAISIQRYFRSYILMKEQSRNYLQLKQSAITVQRRFRAKKLARIERYQYLEKISSIVKIQRYFRATIEMRKVRKSYTNTRYIIMQMQRRFRANKLMLEKRSEYHKLKLATITIQRRYRANLLMKSMRKQYLIMKFSAIKIQTKFRATLHARKIRVEFLAMQYHATIIQQQFRGQRLMRLQRAEFLRLKHATIIIQNRFHANKLMIEQRNNFNQIKNATLIIQRRFRASVEMKNCRTNYLIVRKAIICIQKRYREYKLSKSIRNSYLAMKYAAIVIQRRFRAQKLMQQATVEYKTLINCTITIQRKFRALKIMKLQKQSYEMLRENVIMLQRKFRANIARKIAQLEYLKIRNAIILIQQRFRAQQLMKIQRNKYFEIRKATIIIQHRYRANKEMKKQRTFYLQLKKVTLNLQRKLRAKILGREIRTKFLRLKQATVTIQRQFRAQQNMKIQRKEFMHIRQAAINIQRRFRANKLMKIQKSEYIHMKSAAIKIQRFFRALKLRNIEKAKYVNIRNAAIIIQKRFRAQCEMRKIKAEYLRLKHTTIYIQRLFRANILMQNERNKYNTLRTTVIKIQRLYRAKIIAKRIRNEYLNLKSTVIMIQQKIRARKLMRLAFTDYQNQRNKIIFIQQHIRSFLLGRKMRQEYIELKISAIKIQQWFRSLQLMRKEKAYYKKILQSVQIIQMHWRATLEMRKEREKFLLIKKSTLKIQYYYRAYRLGKIERFKFIQLKQYAIIIQRRYRDWHQMIMIRTGFLYLKSATIRIQRKFRANQLMKLERSKYLQLRTVTIYMQQKYRGRYLTRSCRENFILIRTTILRLQQHSRGYLARKRFNEMMSPEMLELLKRKRAARIIQRYWRGYCVRKKWQNLKIKCIRRKLHELKETVKPNNVLKNKIKACVKCLRGRYKLQDLVCVLIWLENTSRMVPQTLMENALYICTFCYGVMAQAIRSEPDKQIIELCSRILLNLTRYDKPNAERTFQEGGLVTIAHILLRWCDKDCEIFNTLCTLIWVLSHYPNKKRKIREFMTTHEAIFMVRETKKLVLRKEKMRKNVRKPNSFSAQHLNSPISHRKMLPLFDPDFGVVKNKPYIFNCSVFAFDTVLSALDIVLV